MYDWMKRQENNIEYLGQGSNLKHKTSKPTCQDFWNLNAVFAVVKSDVQIFMDF